MPYTTVSRIIVLLLLLPVAACGGGGDPADPGDRAPVITVTGVEDGATVSGPVTLEIRVDRGSFNAELNGEPFFSGRSVSDPGSYLLTVSARNGTATSSLELAFEIVLGGESRLIVRMLDLGSNDAGGGGDAILLTDSSSAGLTHALVDAGPAGAGGSDPGFVARRLQGLGVERLEVLLLTHAHSDHFDAIPAVVGAATVGTFVWNGQARGFSRYNSTVSQARAAAEDELVPTENRTFTLGSGAGASVLTVIPPITTWLDDPDADGSELNEGSLGTELRKGSFRMFLTGDGEVRANQRWRVQFTALTASLDVLKVGHHGANDAVFDNGFNGSSSWLQHTAPEVAVISANGTSHPRVNAIARLMNPDLPRVYCTPVHGDIEIRASDQGVFDVTVERNPDADCEPGSDAST